MDAKGIINYGLGLLGSYSIVSIDPPTSALERKISPVYEQWKESELTRRRWVFNRYYAVLTLDVSAPMETEDRPYGYALPADYLAAVRDKTTTWVIRGRHLYSAETSVVLEYKAKVVETMFDPLFNDVLAARVALEMCEWVTQSNMKKADAAQWYKDAIKVASSNNALIIGPEDELTETDSNDSWIAARAGRGL